MIDHKNAKAWRIGRGHEASSEGFQMKIEQTMIEY